MNECKQRRDGFTQVCVWPGTILNEAGAPASPEDAERFEALMLRHFSTRVQYLEEVKTGPDVENGHPVEGAGGRNDLLFAVHGDDIGRFAVPRLMAGIRWIEDALAPHNSSAHLYPERLRGYVSWDAGIGGCDDDEG